MANKVEAVTYDQALGWLRDHQFDVLEAPGVSNRVFLKKYNVSAAIQRDEDGGVIEATLEDLVDRRAQ